MKTFRDVVRALPMLAMAVAATRQARNCCPESGRAPFARSHWLWDWFYGLDWGEVRTNNYGFSPAGGDGPERFQHQMYGELLKRVQAGGGLAYLAGRWPGPVEAVGLDVADSAIRYCSRAYAQVANLRFVRGEALAIPFADESFDVVVNVEASNEYGDFEAFLREVRRVLRPSGALLWCDSRRSGEEGSVAAQLERSGFVGELRDITGHVVAACEADTPRRLAIIESAPLPLRLFFRRQLGEYAAIAGSLTLEEYRSRRRVYLMTCAVRTDAGARIAPPPSL